MTDVGALHEMTLHKLMHAPLGILVVAHVAPPLYFAMVR
jgi:hypothetical protein